ncbi:MAG: hypothetical protein P8X92_10730, partial [Dehalococcoidia bacterium]
MHRHDNQLIQLALTERQAELKPASDIFAVAGVSGNDYGVSQLIDLMRNHGTLFYKSSAEAHSAGPSGLISGDDTIIIKVNSQWDERGGTNTDLLKALISAVTRHPDGFTGEIIVADNGQTQYGSSGRGGSFDYPENNAEETSQSIQKVVDSFANHRVSTYLWDRITTKRVAEYAEGNTED